MNFLKKLHSKQKFLICFLSSVFFISFLLYSDKQNLTNPSETVVSAAMSYFSPAPHHKNLRYKFGQQIKLIRNEILTGLTECFCPRFVHQINEVLNFKAKNSSSFGESTCSDFATRRGRYQKVISYSYYYPGDKTDVRSDFFKKYFGMMHSKLQFIQSQMPGWVVRIYHNISSEDTVAVNLMCDVYCSFENVDFCNVTKLPVIGNLYKRQASGRLWRFAAMGDPTVDVFISRDTDSYIISREITAINEWLNSTKDFHLMRDHPNHRAVMLAGLWGGKNKRQKELADLRDKIFAEPTSHHKHFDQALLASYVFPFIHDSLLQHTSYTCVLYAKTTPFSTKREEGLFVGWSPMSKNSTRILLKKKCPFECRPKEHKNWEHC